MRFQSKKIIGIVLSALVTALALLCISQTSLVKPYIKYGTLYSHSKDNILKGPSIFSTSITDLPQSSALHHFELSTTDLAFAPDCCINLHDTTKPLPYCDLLDDCYNESSIPLATQPLITVFHTPVIQSAPVLEDSINQQEMLAALDAEQAQGLKDLIPIEAPAKDSTSTDTSVTPLFLPSQLLEPLSPLSKPFEASKIPEDIAPTLINPVQTQTRENAPSVPSNNDAILDSAQQQSIQQSDILTPITPASAPVNTLQRTPQSVSPSLVPTPNLTPFEDIAPIQNNPTPAPTPAPAPTTSPITPTIPTPIIPSAPVTQPAVTPTISQPSSVTTAATPTQANPEGFLIKFNNISIIEYIQFISGITKKNFIFNEEDLGFNVTIVSNDLTTVENIMTALLQELRVHGLSLIEVDNNLIIHSNPGANAPPKLQKDNPTDTDLVTRVFRLVNTSPDKMAQIILPLLSNLSLVSAMHDSGCLIVTDLTANVNKIAELIEELDSTKMALDIGQYVLTNTPIDVAAKIAGRILAPIAQGKVLVITPDVNTNSIFIVSSAAVVEKALDILSEIDIPRERQVPEFNTEEGIEFDNNPSELREALAGYGSNEGFAEAEEYMSPAERAQAEALRRAILARGGQDALAQARMLSRRGVYERIKYFIQPIYHRSGALLQESLQRVAESLAGADLLHTNLKNDELIAALNNSQWIIETNSIVISGTVEAIEGVRRIIEQIDTPIRQVFIEMLILDTTVNDSLNFGVDWITDFGNPNSAGVQGFTQANSPLESAIQTAVPGSNINVLTSGSTTTSQNVVSTSTTATTTTSTVNNGLIGDGIFSMGIIGRNIIHNGTSYGSLGLLIQALHIDTKTNIVMNPKIVVEENTTAELFVGTNTRYRTQSVANNLGTILTTNYEYRDVGSTLRVTPRINNGNMITLDIEQEVSSDVGSNGLAGSVGANSGGSSAAVPAATAANIDAGPVTRKSKTTTRIHVPDDYFVILSGMIQDEDTNVRSQVPCLGGIPLIGATFSQKKRTDAKRNLMIFIRPHIVENCEFNRMTKRQQDIFQQKNVVPKRWQREVDEALDFLNVKPNYDPEYQRW